VDNRALIALIYGIAVGWCLQKLWESERKQLVWEVADKVHENLACREEWRKQHEVEEPATADASA